MRRKIHACRKNNETWKNKGITTYSEKEERFWIIKLKTFHPYGLKQVLNETKFLNCYLSFRILYLYIFHWQLEYNQHWNCSRHLHTHTYIHTLLFMLPLCMAASFSVCHRCFVFVSVLFSLLTQCTSKGYCHHYLYDLALVLLVSLLTLLVYNFPYGDFIVN